MLELDVDCDDDDEKLENSTEVLEVDWLIVELEELNEEVSDTSVLELMLVSETAVLELDVKLISVLCDVSELVLAELVEETKVELDEDFDNWELSLEEVELDVSNKEELENSSNDTTKLPSIICQRFVATSEERVAPLCPNISWKVAVTSPSMVSPQWGNSVTLRPSSIVKADRNANVTNESYINFVWGNLMNCTSFPIMISLLAIVSSNTVYTSFIVTIPANWSGFSKLRNRFII